MPNLNIHYNTRGKHYDEGPFDDMEKARKAAYALIERHGVASIAIDIRDEQSNTVLVEPTTLVQEFNEGKR
jgi:hypothetical protein